MKKRDKVRDDSEIVDQCNLGDFRKNRKKQEKMKLLDDPGAFYHDA